MRCFTADEARKLIAEGRGRRYDPEVLDAFLEIVGHVEPEYRAEVAVSAEHLKPGMVLSRDLMSREGVLLLSADYLLDEALIRQIRTYARTEGILMNVFVRNTGASNEKTAAG